MIRVLFVCLGNICRSPMAEAVFAHMVREAGLEGQIECDSAGTSKWHVGSPANGGTLGVLARSGIAYDGRARVLCAADLADFDYIVTMDDDNMLDVLALQKAVQGAGGGKARIVPLLSYSPEVGLDEVPDPYYTGDFDGVYKMVTAACMGLLEEIGKDELRITKQEGRSD